jgi:hypothetical protein
MSELSGRRTSAAAAIRFACSSAGILFGEPFGNHSKFQVVIRMTAPSPSDEASETNARINAMTSKKVRESMCGADEEGYPTVNVAYDRSRLRRGFIRQDSRCALIGLFFPMLSFNAVRHEICRA